MVCVGEVHPVRIRLAPIATPIEAMLLPDVYNFLADVIRACLIRCRSPGNVRVYIPVQVNANSIAMVGKRVRSCAVVHAPISIAAHLRDRKLCFLHLFEDGGNFRCQPWMAGNLRVLCRATSEARAVFLPPCLPGSSWQAFCNTQYSSRFRQMDPPSAQAGSRRLSERI